MQAKAVKLEDFKHLNRDLPRSIDYILDHPEQASELDVLSSPPAQIMFLRGYREQIHMQLSTALKWMYSKHLHPKLEGR